MAEQVSTVVVPAETVAAPGLAWSADDSREPVLLPRSWNSVARRAAGVVAACVAVAGMIVVIDLHWFPRRAETVVAEPAPLPRATPDPVPRLPSVADAPRKISADKLYNVLLSRAGITLSDGVDDDASAGQLGHEICRSLATGHTGAQIEADTVATSHFSDGSSPTPAQARAFVEAAEQVYCPQYAGR